MIWILSGLYIIYTYTYSRDRVVRFTIPNMVNATRSNRSSTPNPPSRDLQLMFTDVVWSVIITIATRDVLEGMSQNLCAAAHFNIAVVLVR